MMSAFWGELSL